MPVVPSRLVDDVARLDQRLVAGIRIGERLLRQHHELVHVELVVGEEHVVLEMQRTGRGVVREPGQRVVDPLRRERRQRARAVLGAADAAVDDVIVHGVEVGHVEVVAQRPVQGLGDRALDVGVLLHGEMQGDRRVRGADPHRHAVVLDQEPDLLQQVALEEVRTGDRGLVASRLGDMAERQAAVHPRGFRRSAA